MKFAQQLRQGAVEEWRRAYVDYRLLKKLIKAAALSEEPGAEEDGEESEAGRPLNVPDHSPPDSSFARNNPASSSEDDGGLGPFQRAQLAKVQSRSSARQQEGDASDLRRRKLSSRPSSVRDSRWRYPPDLPLEETVKMMNASERKFFDVLDKELEKVEAFYEEREAEAIERCKVLREQLAQLAEHREEYLAKHSGPSRLVRPLFQYPPAANVRKRNNVTHPDSPADSQQNGDSSTGGRDPDKRLSRHLHLNPETYVAARRKLKLATFETYKFLGYVKNYRLLNRTGFSKATKKMEKMTRIKCQSAYMQKVHRAAFSTSTIIDDLQSQVEAMFGASFEKGSRKKAIQRLRFMGASPNHHFASWRAGIMLGLAVPAFVDALVKASQSATQARIPGYPSLLQLYGAMGLPPLLALGIGVNLLGWHRAHINIPLVFYFDSRTMIDFRQYFEIPSLLILTLSYCMWLSFNIISNTISPQVWPLVWLFSTIVILFNPAPVFHREARWWIIRSTVRVLTAGLVRVEFRDFWLGDQFVSLYYTSYNLGLLVCTYSHHWQSDINSVCSTNSTWASAALTALPYLWRLGQSLRRYHDSRDVITHLINAGKYAAGIVYYTLYFSYRIKGSHHHGGPFALFITFATINSIYSLVWDLLMDWNLGNRNSRHKFLRNELVYNRQKWFYYFAIFTNTILRFNWAIYILPDTNLRLKGFLTSLVEVFRRWQWNFLRVESEHVGNVDAYRSTRDVPLPYALPRETEHAAATILEDQDEDEEQDANGGVDMYANEPEPPANLGPRITRITKLLPDTVGRKLRTAILGRRTAMDESDDEEEDSPHSAAEGPRRSKDSSRERQTSQMTGTTKHSGNDPTQHSNDRKNYNTFGWDSDVEGVRSPDEAHKR